jgi:hypothetical protein
LNLKYINTDIKFIKLKIDVKKSKSKARESFLIYSKKII